MAAPDHQHTLDSSTPHNGVERLYRVGLSQAFIGKEQRGDYHGDAFGKSFIQTDVPLRVYVQHILDGKANIPHCFEGNTRRNETFISTEFAAYDLELPNERSISIAEVLQLEFVRRHAFLIHHTGSSGIVVPDKNPHGYWRIRVYFRWSQRIDGVERARALFVAGARYLQLPGVDKASFKPAQPYYGSTIRLEEPYINLNAEALPVGDVAQELELQATGEMLAALAPAPVYIPLNGVEAEAKAWDRYNEQLAVLRAAPKGSRNNELTRIAFIVFGMAKGSYPGITEELVERDLKKIADDWGGDVKKSHKLIERQCKKAPVFELVKRQPTPTRTRVQMRQPADGSVRIVERASDQQIDAPLDYAQAPERPAPLTLWQNAMFMYTAETYTLIEYYVRRLPHVHFSVAEYAEAAGIDHKTAKKRIDAACVWGAVSRWEFLQSRVGGENTICKNSQRQIRGAAVGERYYLTPDRAMPMIERELWNAVLETLERGVPDTIHKTEAAEAFPDHGDAFAARLHAVTSAAANSLAAEEVRADDERLAFRIADEIKRRAQYDETPLVIDCDPANVADIRRRAIETYVAQEPTANHLQGGEMSWVAGAKRSAMSALIRTSRLTPSAKPTLTPVMLPGKDLYAEALAAAKKNKGAVTSWLDRKQDVIRGFSSSVPEGAAGVLINQGKTYTRHERIEPLPAEDKETPITASLTPEQEAEQEAKSATRRARSGMILRLRGCMRARDWRYIPGAFGYWERIVRDEWGKAVRREFAENTAEGMAGALVADYEWAVQQDMFLEDAEALA